MKPERDEKGRKMRRILLTLAKIFAVIAAAFLLCGSARAEGSGEYGDINSYPTQFRRRPPRYWRAAG